MVARTLGLEKITDRGPGIPVHKANIQATKRPATHATSRRALSTRIRNEAASCLGPRSQGSGERPPEDPGIEDRIFRWKRERRSQFPPKQKILAGLIIIRSAVVDGSAADVR